MEKKVMVSAGLEDPIEIRPTVFPHIVNYSFLNLKIVENSNSCHKFHFFT